MRLASLLKTRDRYDCIHSLTDDREVEEEYLTIHRQCRSITYGDTCVYKQAPGRGFSR